MRLRARIGWFLRTFTSLPLDRYLSINVICFYKQLISVGFSPFAKEVGRCMPDRFGCALVTRLVLGSEEQK